MTRANRNMKVGKKRRRGGNAEARKTNYEGSGSKTRGIIRTGRKKKGKKVQGESQPRKAVRKIRVKKGKVVKKMGCS